MTEVFTIFRMMQTTWVYIMGLFYILAGIYHFVRPKFYTRIMPSWIPLHLQIVYISGACEITLGLLLFPLVTRSVAAWGIIVLLIAIFPANIQMMLNFRRRKNPYLWITIVRLPLQVLLIWWAWLYT
ncbi:MAG: DoxX family protein [Bacteroidota bacterium]